MFHLLTTISVLSVNYAKKGALFIQLVYHKSMMAFSTIQ